MSSGRIGSTNIVLMVVTVAALLFAVWSRMEPSGDSRGPAPNRPACVGEALPADNATAPLPGGSTSPLPGGNAGSGTEAPAGSTGTAGGTPGTVQPSPEQPPLAANQGPSDKGDAVISGRVLSADGRPVAGATVTAICSDLQLEPPSYEDLGLAAYRAEVERFLLRAAAERRTAQSDAQGSFRFAGLDSTRSYYLYAELEGTGEGSAERVAAGDSAVIVLAAACALKGRVVTQDGTPVTSFTVRAWRLNRDWEAEERAFSAADGRFSMPLKAGLAQLRVEAAGYATDKPVEVSVGADNSETTITLQRAALLSGVVSDSTGRPVVGAEVTVGEETEGRGRRWNWNRGGGETGSTRTDSKGRYRFETLTPGATQVTASFGSSNKTEQVTLVQGETVLNFTLEGGARVLLRLKGPQGQPLDADEVWFQSGRDWADAERLPAREPGLAEFAGLQPGEYTLTISIAGFPAVRQKVTVKDGDNSFEFPVSEGAMLSGTVMTSAGAPMTGVGVRLRKDDEEAWGGWGTGRFANVGADGKYKLGPAEPGTWKLEVYQTNEWKLVQASQVVLAAGENTQNLVVDSGATLTVTVTDEAGNKVGWAEVQLRGEQNFSGQSNQEGVASIAFVQPGLYTVYASSRSLVSKNQSVSVVNGENRLAITLQKANCSRLTWVYPDTQASRVGLQAGDLVFEYNGEAIASWAALGQAIRNTKAEQDVTMQVERNGQILTFQLKGGRVGIEGADGAR
ncbi:MAG: carboxypeptidase regulatory-like domain-containing protein [Planctomycetes bacterium]|nr:carboxypeptidase regulatory-like domain-containing protein [Planctomycetota bacterium]